MNRTIMALFFAFFITQPCPCQERSGMVGADFSSVTHGCAELEVSFSFAGHWSVTGEAVIPYNKFTRSRSTLEMEHEAEFTDMSQTQDGRCVSGARVLMSYWPLNAFSGPNLSIGLSSLGTTDVIIEAGYMIPVWKGIRLSASISTYLLSPHAEGYAASSSIKVGVHYKF